MNIDSPNSTGISTGFGIPTGGTVNQTLIKNSSTNYDTSWQTRTPQYIGVVKSGDQTSVNSGTDIAFTSVDSSNGLTLSSNSVTLTGGKVYQITAGFSCQNFSNTGNGYLQFSLCNSSNTVLSQAQAIVYIASNSQAYSPMLTCIYSPSSNTTVKFRCTDSSGMATVRDRFSFFTITEII
jgi:hypothetical protein